MSNPVRNVLVYTLPQMNINNNFKIYKNAKTEDKFRRKERFTFTGTGKIKRHHAYHSHILTKKTKKQKRNLVHQTLVDGTNLKQVRDLLRLR